MKFNYAVVYKTVLDSRGAVARIGYSHNLIQEPQGLTEFDSCPIGCCITVITEEALC